MPSIISIRHSKGNYEGSDYDNIVFQCFSDEAPKGLLTGQPIEDIKVKTDVVIDCFGKSVSSIDWESMLGSELLVTYGKNSKVLAVSVSKFEPDAADAADQAVLEEVKEKDKSKK